MKNNMLFYLLGVTLVLSGCVTVDPTKKLATALDKSSKVTLHHEPKMLLDPSLLNHNSPLGICQGTSDDTKDKIHSKIQELAKTDVIELLRDNSLLKIKDGSIDLKKLSFSIGSQDAIGWFGGGGFLEAINQMSSNLFFKAGGGEAEKDDMLVKMLHFYVSQYVDGKFVLRDGTKLAKPNGNITHEKIQTPTSDGGKKEKDIVSASLDKGTVSGLTTVVLEALFDYCHGMKVVAIEDGKISHNPSYEKTGSKNEAGDDLYNLFYIEEEKDDYLFGDENNNKPTIVEFFEKKSRTYKEKAEAKEKAENELKKAKLEKKSEAELKKAEDKLKKAKVEFKEEKEKFMHYICKETKCNDSDLKKKDVAAIRKLSDLNAEGTKAVAGATIKSLGGLGVSFAGFVKLSIGDNDSVKQFIETAASVVTKRKTEYLLYALREKNSECPNGRDNNGGDNSCQSIFGELIKNLD